MSDAELLAAYFSTRWAVRLPESTATLRLDERFPAPPALLPAGIITAYNPASVLQTAAENQAAQERLTQALMPTGASLLAAEAAGTGEQASLWTEPAFLVTHLSRDRLVALGVRFGQNAIVWIDGEGRASLVSTRGGFLGTSPGDVLPLPPLQARMLVRDRMQREPITVTPDSTLASALKLTREHRIRHLPVVLEHGELTGILSDRDIRLAMPSPLTVADAERTEFLERTSVAAVMSREVITVTGVTTVEDAAKLLYRHRIGSLPVVDPQGRLEGILTETDILHVFVEILGGTGPSSRLELALPDEPGELARAMRVIGEELKLNIASLVVSSRTSSQGRKVAIIHLATIDPRETIRALEGKGWEVGWPSLDWDLRSLEEGA